MVRFLVEVTEVASDSAGGFGCGCVMLVVGGGLLAVMAQERRLWFAVLLVSALVVYRVFRS